MNFEDLLVIHCLLSVTHSCYVELSFIFYQMVKYVH